MTVLYADTSWFVAYLNRRDAHHRQATTFLQDSAARFVTTQWVLCELANYFASSTLRREVAAFIRDLRADDRFTIVSAASAMFDDALLLYEARPDKKWSFTDCISIVTIQKLNLTLVLTADHHFAQAGFKVLLQRDP